MGLKEIIKKTFLDEEKIVLERYRGSKFAFIILGFLFFINFYFVGAGFHLDIFEGSLGIMYILLILSTVFYIYFFLKKTYFKIFPNYLFIVILILLLLMFCFLVLPLILTGGINGILDLIKFYS